MTTVMIEAPTEDRAFFENLRDAGHDVEVVEVDRFEGLPEILQAIVIVHGSVTPILIHFLTEKRKSSTARKVIKNGRKYEVSGYSADEVKQLLESEE